MHHQNALNQHRRWSFFVWWCKMMMMLLMIRKWSEIFLSTNLHNQMHQNFLPGSANNIEKGKAKDVKGSSTAWAATQQKGSPTDSNIGRRLFCVRIFFRFDFASECRRRFAYSNQHFRVEIVKRIQVPYAACCTIIIMETKGIFRQVFRFQRWICAINSFKTKNSFAPKESTKVPCAHFLRSWNWMRCEISLIYSLDSICKCFSCFFWQRTGLVPSSRDFFASWFFK